MFDTMMESTMRLRDMDAAIITEGRKNSMNFLPTSAPFLSSSQFKPFSMSALRFRRIFSYTLYIFFFTLSLPIVRGPGFEL